MNQLYLGGNEPSTRLNRVYKDSVKTEDLLPELVQLLRKQKDILDARSLGAANEGEVVDYELRQEVIHDICQILANSSES